MRNLLRIMPFLILSVLGCQEVENPSIIQKPQEQTQNKIHENFIEYLKLSGYKNIEKLKIDEFEDKFIVSNEIQFKKVDVLKELDLLKNSKTYLWRRSDFTPTTPFQKRVIPYRFNSRVSSSFKDKIIDAFNTWNSIRNFNINFFYDPTGSISGSYVDIDYDNYISGFNVGQPNSFNDFGLIYDFSPSTLNSYSTSKQKWLFVHMIGHLIGLRHEDDSNLTWVDLVPGTFEIESYTMYKYSIDDYDNGPGVPDWAGFYYTDLLGVRYLWPHDTSEKPLYSYTSNTTGWGNWTTNWDTYQYGTTQYGYWGVTGYIFTSVKSGTIPLYRYTHSTGTPYISTNPSLHITYPSFTKNNTLGYVYSSSGSNRIPVYEWYNPNIGYYFTTNTNDNYVQSSGWIGGGIAFYTLSLI
ncbi:hypothetical protein [Algoriphagus pacificus]|uniref:DUF5648 domain-containing protein n=1 Tax=Algoriphagus pacificus TaxID=2811234 RepID=A0ABS3CAT0_9BACT|nr:hypothetical protein [Algoriphagus pacificus]MBN7814219.1 hypothetical protein [Algoriphagus pacificus]